MHYCHNLEWSEYVDVYNHEMIYSKVTVSKIAEAAGISLTNLRKKGTRKEELKCHIPCPLALLTLCACSGQEFKKPRVKGSLKAKNLTDFQLRARNLRATSSGI